jgi:hypothetical protein
MEAKLLYTVIQIPPYGLAEAPEHYWGMSGNDGLPRLEQAWIWGLDSFPPEYGLE